MNNKGVITLKVLVILTGVIMIFSLLIGSLYQQFLWNQKRRNERLMANNILANYKTYIYVNYGLYGFEEQEEVGFITHNINEIESYDIVYEESLREVHVVKKQILEFMKVRMPVNYLEMVLSKVEVIKKAKASQNVLDHKSILDMAVSDISHIYDKKMSLSLLVNEVTESLVNEWKNYDSNELTKALSKYKKANEDLFQVVVELSEETLELQSVINETKSLVMNDDEALEVIKTQILDSINDYEVNLGLDQFTYQGSEAFMTYMTEHYKEVDERFYSVLEILYNNMQALEKSYEDLSYMKVYGHVESLSYSTDPEAKAYYKNQQKASKSLYQPKITGNTIDITLPYESKGQGGFWQIISFNLEDMIEDMTINEYVISTFKSFSESSDSDYDYFSKYVRSSYLKRGEVEYILMGHHSEIGNVAETLAIIYGIRVMMNGIHVYTDKEKLALSETIGLAVAGWTGFGAPVVSNIIRAGWTISESLIDMQHLVKGKNVAFYKIHPDQWQLDLGLFYEKKTLPGYFALMDFNYHDYLRLMLLTVDTDSKIKRIINLIELNHYTDYQSFVLHKLYTKVRINDYETSYYE